MIAFLVYVEDFVVGFHETDLQGRGLRLESVWFLVCFYGDFEAICFENLADFLFRFFDSFRRCFAYRQSIVTVEAGLVFEFRCNKGQHVYADKFACLGSIIIMSPLSREIRCWCSSFPLRCSGGTAAIFLCV